MQTEAKGLYLEGSGDEDIVRTGGNGEGVGTRMRRNSIKTAAAHPAKRMFPAAR
jgi:hypothetical protein